MDDQLQPGHSEAIAALERILASPAFARSPRLAQFLRFVVEERLAGRTDPPKEYELGVRVFQRSPDYDTRVDPIIRVQARQLRFKLREYYAGEGSAESLRIELPKGSYLPTFYGCETGPPAAEPPPGQPAAMARRPSRWLWMTATLSIGLVASAWFLGVWRFGQAQAAARRVDPVARDLYLQGRYRWHRRTSESLHQAVESFTQAIARDPNYAEAYAGLADCYNLLPEFSSMPGSEAFARALVAARKAVELDGSLAGAHASLAFASFYGELDTATADREFRRAIRLDPGNAEAHHWYATALMTMGRSGQALGEIERARELQPDSQAILADKGAILANAGRPKEAVALLKQLEAAEPAFVSPHRYLAQIYLSARDFPNYLAEERQWAELSHDQPGLAVAAAAERGFGGGGAQGMLESILRQQKKLYLEGSVGAYDLVRTCALLGRNEEAMGYLRVVREKRDFMVLISRIDPFLAGLRQEAEYRELLARGGFPPVQ